MNKQGVAVKIRKIATIAGEGETSRGRAIYEAGQDTIRVEVVYDALEDRDVVTPVAILDLAGEEVLHLINLLQQAYACMVDIQEEEAETDVITVMTRQRGRRTVRDE